MPPPDHCKQAIILYYTDDDTKASDDATSLSTFLADVFGRNPSIVNKIKAKDQSLQTQLNY